MPDDATWELDALTTALLPDHVSVGGVRRALQRILAGGEWPEPLPDRPTKWKKPRRIARIAGPVRGFIPIWRGKGRTADILVLSENGDKVFRYRHGAGEFIEVTELWGVRSQSRHAALLDMNRDGRVDLVSYSGRHLTVWLQTPKNTFDCRAASLLVPGCRGIAPLDFGVLGDVGVVLSSKDSPRFVYLSEAGGLEQRPLPAGPQAAPAAINHQLNNKALRGGAPVTTRGFLRSGELGASHPWGARRISTVADFDGDSIPDVLEAYEFGGRLFRGTPTGEFLAPNRVAAGPLEPRRILVGGMASSVPFVLQRQGTIYSGLGKAEVNLVDVDNDGKMDVFFTCENGERVVWRNVGCGRFEGPYPAGWDLERMHMGRLHGAMVGDIDCDGWQDILVLQAGRTVAGGLGPAFFRNRGGGMYDRRPGYIKLSGEARKGCFIDIDGDGVDDLILGLPDGSVWLAERDVRGAGLRAVRVRLSEASRFSGPLTVSAWAGSSCLGSRLLTVGGAEAVFGMTSPGAVTLKWRFPGERIRTAVVSVSDRPVWVSLGRTGVASPGPLPGVFRQNLEGDIDGTAPVDMDCVGRGRARVPRAARAPVQPGRPSGLHLRH